MPDFFSNLNATGIGQVPQSSNIAPLPKIDFSELPTYMPNTLNTGIATAGGMAIDPFKMNFNPTDFTRLAPSTVDNRELEKYANSSAFKTLGYNKRENLDDRENAYDQQQPWWEATGNSLAKFGDKTWSSFTGFFKQNLDTFDSLSKFNAQNNWKTDSNLAGVEHDEQMEKLFPSFKSAAGTKWYSFIPGTKGSGDFYEQFVPQLGFTVGMMAGAIAENTLVDFLTGGIGALGEGVNTARKVYGAITGFTNLKRGVQLAEGITKGNALVTGLRMGANGWAFYNTAASEAAMEGAQNFNETKQAAIEQYKLKHGYEPGGEDLKKIEDAATSAGNRTFGTNIPLLSISNAIQFESILFPEWARQKALKGGMKGWEVVNEGAKLESKFAAHKLAEKTFSEAWKAGNALTRAKMLGTFFTGEKFAFVSEGFEEIAQRGVASTNKDYALDQIYGDADYTKSIRYGVSDMFTTDGAQEFIGGALGGLLFQGTGHIASKFATPTTTKNEKGDEETKFNFLNRIGIFSEKYQDRQRGAYAQQVAESMNHDSLKDVLKDQGFRDLILSGRNGDQMKKYLERNDIFNFRNMKSDALNRFFYSALKTGKIDLRLAQLADFTSLTNDEFKEALGAEATPEALESLVAIRDYLEQKAKGFEDIYHKQGARFEGEMKLARGRYALAKKNFDDHLSTLKEKYETEDQDKMFEDINNRRIELRNKFDEASKIDDEEDRDSALEKLNDEAEKFIDDNTEKLQDQAKHNDLNALQNYALIDYAAVEEGKKAALFAYSDMIDSADRARETLAALKENPSGIKYSEVEDLLDPVNVKKTLARYQGYVKSINLGQMDARAKKELDSNIKRIDILEKLLKEYDVAAKTKTITAAELIHEYLLSDPTLENVKAFTEWSYTEEKQNRDLTHLSDLVKLQKRNQENLNLYNRLVSPALEGHTGAVSKLLRDFIERAEKYHKDLINNAQKAEAPVPTTVTTPSTPEGLTPEVQPNATTTLAEVENPPAQQSEESEADKQINALLEKTQRGEPLNDVDFSILESFASQNENAGKAYEAEKARREANKPPEAPPEKPPVEPVFPEGSTPIELTPTAYIPEVPGVASQEAVYEATTIGDHKNTLNPLRTIISEVIDWRDGGTTIDPETQFRQKFLDKLAQQANKGNFKGVLEIDRVENYPEGTRERVWLDAHPNDLGLVLKIVDLNNRDTFDEDYNPSTTGRKLFFSLNDSNAKTNLLATMRAKGVTQIPDIELTKVSTGVWDKGELRPASELLEGISTGDYRLEVAKAPFKGGLYKFESKPNKYPLMNGGFYINSRGSYAKLLPQTVDNVKVDGQVRDLLGLFDIEMTDIKLATRVGQFLSDMLLFGQDDVFGDPMKFIVLYDNKTHKVKIGGYMLDENGGTVMLSTDETKAYLLKTNKGTIRRINVSDAWLYTDMEFFYAENGEVKSIQDVNYNAFILANTLSNKKNYTLNGEKIVKSVNRYLEINDAFEDTKKNLEKKIEAPPVATFDRKELIGSLLPVLQNYDFNNPTSLPAISNFLKQISSEITQDLIDKSVAAKDFGPILQILARELVGKKPEATELVREVTQEDIDKEVVRRAKLESVSAERAISNASLRGETELQAAKNYLLPLASPDKKYENKYDYTVASVTESLAGKTPELPEQKTEELAQPTITPTVREIKKLDEGESGDDLSKALDRRKSQALKEVMGFEEVKFIKDRFGEEAVRHLKDIVDADRWGLWHNGVITLYSDAQAGTGYHEAWHHFSQMYMTQDDKRKLYNELRSKLPALRNASNLDVEEYIAEDFRKFVQSGGKIMLETRPVRNNIFTKILDLIRYIFRLGPRLGKLYSQLNTGDFQQYKPNINNALFGKLNSRISNAKGEELLPANKVTRYLRYMDSLVGNFIAEDKINFAYFGIKKGNLAGRTMKKAKAYLYNRIGEARNRIVKEELAHIEATGKNSVKQGVIDDLDIIINNFDSVFKSYIKLSDYDLNRLSEKELDKAFATVDNVEDGEVGIEDDATKLEQKETQNSDKVWDIGGNEVSLINDASSQTKSLIRTLSKVQVDSSGSPRIENGRVLLSKNEYGLTEPVDFSQMFNNLGILLEGSYSDEDILEKMQDVNNQKRLPELALLLERLPNKGEITNYSQLETWVSFFQDFSKVYIPIFSLLKMKDGTYRFIEETKNSKKQIEKQWTNNFFNIDPKSPLVTQGDVLHDEHGRPYINKDIPLNLDLNREQDREKLFDLLGMSFSPLTRASDEFAQAAHPDNLKLLLNTLKARLKMNQSLYNPSDDISHEYGGMKGESKTINNLLNVEAKYSNVSPSMSFRNAEGEMQYGLSLNMYLTSTNYWLSRSKSYKDIMRNPSTQHLNIFNNPYIKNSLFLNSMFNLENPKSDSFGSRRVNGQPIVIQLGNYNGIKFEDPKLPGHSTTSLSPREKVIMDMNALLTQGAIEIMRTESSASAFFIKLSNYTQNSGKKQNLPFTLKDIGGDINRKALRDRMVGYFEDEINTVLNKYNSPLPNYYGSKDSPGRISQFSKILPEKTGLRNEIEKELQKYIDDTTRTPAETQEITDKIIQKFGVQVGEASIRYFNQQSTEMMNFLAKKQITLDDMSKKFEEAEGNRPSLKQLVNTFVVNDYILNTEFSKLFSGNVAYYKAYHKRSKGDISTGRRALVSPIVQKYLNDTKFKTLAAALGVEGDINVTETKTITITDDERASVNQESLVQGIMATSNKTREEAEAILGDKYLKMNVADGQGHCTLDFYRQFRISIANWSFDDEQTFEREVIGYKLRKNLHANEEDRKKDEARLASLGDTQVYWPPIKMQHNGPLKIKGAHAPILDKFSIAPLIPSVIKGSVWDEVHDKLIKGGISYSKMQSGSKKYQFPSINLYDKNWTPSLDITPENTATVFTENLKEQIATHGKIKKESTWGTQMRKLFMANLFSIGTSQAKFVQILANYKTIMNRMMESEREGLYREFGITPKGNKLEIQDARKFIQSLQEQAGSRKMNDNILDSIQYDASTGKPRYFLEINLNRPAIEDMINGMIYSRLTRIKLNGDMLIQVASTGFESVGFKYTNATEEDKKKWGTNGLSFYHIVNDKIGKPSYTASMGVKVALAGEWTKLLNAQHTDGRKIGDIDRLNALLQTDWAEKNKNRLTMIGYRIPTQGPNSMEFMQVAEFLPPIAGSIVILPAEIVAKAGSDYDIDKMNIFRPSMDSNGDYISDARFLQNESALKRIQSGLDKIKESNAAAARFYNAIMQSVIETEEKTEDEAYDPSLIDASTELNPEEKKLLNKFYELNSSKKPYYTNKLIEIYREVLSSPEMFTQLVTPNNTDLIKPLAVGDEKNPNKYFPEGLAGIFGINTKNYTDGEILEYLSNLNKFDQLTAGKDSLGSFALGNNMSQLLQQSGMTLNSTYKLRKSSGYSKEQEMNTYTEIDRRVNLLLLSPNERQTILSTTTIPDTTKVNQNHAMTYKMKAADNLTGEDTTTIDLIEQGKRTATTRSFPLGKVGDVVTFEGRPQKYVITKVEKLTKENTEDPSWIKEWSAKEQWTQEHFKQVLGGKTVHIGSYQTSFKKLEDKTEVNFTIDYSSSRTVDGLLKQEFFSQLINSTVDIASDPYFIAFGITGDNINLVIHGINLGIPFERLLMFINQPVVKRYNELLEKGVPRGKAKSSILFPGSMKGRGESNDKILDEIEKLDNSQGENFYFSTGALNEVIQKAKKNYVSYSQTAQRKEARFQQVAFAHYLKMQEQAELLGDLQQSSNFDTKKFLSGISIEANLRLRDRVKTANLFNQDAVQRILNDSLISSFNNLEETKSILIAMMPVANQRSFLTGAAIVMEEYRGREKIRLERTLVNDWTEYLIKNYGTVEGKNFEEYSLPLIQGTNTLAQTLYAMKNKYPELKAFKLMSLLYPNYSTKVTEKKNVELYRGLDNTTDFQNSLIEDYDKFLHFKGTEIPGQSYTPEQVAEIRDFFIKLQYASFQQSGFNKSPISSIDIVPYQVFTEMADRAIKAYIEAYKANPANAVAEVKEFIHLFKRENYKFRLTGNPNMNTEPYRGKTYRRGSTGENNLPTKGTPAGGGDLLEDQGGDEDADNLFKCIE